MSLSQPIVTVLQEFEAAFSRPTWRKVQVLIIGTLLSQGSAYRGGCTASDGFERGPPL